MGGMIITAPIEPENRLTHSAIRLPFLPYHAVPCERSYDSLGVPIMFYPWDETRGPEAWPIGSCQRSCETSHLRASATPWYWAITFGSGSPAAPTQRRSCPPCCP